MRTVIADVRTLAYPLTGIGRYVYELLTRLISRSNAEWLCLSPRPIPPSMKSKFPTHVRWVEGVEGQRAEWWTQRQAARAVRAHPGALFLGLCNSLPLFTPASCECAMVVYDLCFFIVPRLTHPKDLLKGFLITLPAMRRADRILAISPEVRDELHRYVPRTRGRTAVLPPGGTRFDGPSRLPFPDRRGFLAVGAHRRKNTDLLLTAYALLPEALRASHPLNVLAREIPPALERKVKRLGIGDDVRVVPDAGDEELGHFYSSAVALVFPSAYEGLGLPVTEAMLVGLPSIVMRRSPMARLVGGGGILLGAPEPGELSAAMWELTKDEQSWEMRSAAALAASGDISWDRVADGAAEALGLR